MNIDYQNVIKSILFNELITECEVVEHLLTNYKYESSLVHFIYNELIFECLSKNDYQLCLYLINLPNINLNIINYEGQTPLIKCCELLEDNIHSSQRYYSHHLNTEILTLSNQFNQLILLIDQLIKLGASLEMQDNTGHNALMYSCMNIRSQTVTINLINHGCQLNQLNINKETALFHLCNYINLLKYGKRIFSNSKEEDKKIDSMIDNEVMPLIALMINKGADPNLTNFKNRTILDSAIYYKNYYFAVKLINMIPSLKHLDESLFYMLREYNYGYEHIDCLIQLFDIMIKHGAKLVYCDENQKYHPEFDYQPIIGNYHLNDQLKNIIVKTMVERQDWILLKKTHHTLMYYDNSGDPYECFASFRSETVSNVFWTYIKEHNLVHLIPSEYHPK